MQLLLSLTCILLIATICQAGIIAGTMNGLLGSATLTNAHPTSLLTTETTKFQPHVLPGTLSLEGHVFPAAGSPPVTPSHGIELLGAPIFTEEAIAVAPTISLETPNHLAKATVLIAATSPLVSEHGLTTQVLPIETLVTGAGHTIAVH